MGQASKDGGIVDFERHRLQLEENVSKLHKSLQYWQTWEAEYEGLKEEISGLGDQHTHAELKKASDEFEGDLLNQKEINLLLKDTRGHPRSSQQILGLLDRRIEYVQTNINSVKSLLHEAETKAAAFVAVSAEVCNDEGLPLAEIREDLDDEGNVISSSITSPSDAAPLVLERLRKSGVEELPESKVQKKDVANITGDEIASHKPTDVESRGLDVAGAGVIDKVESTASKADTTASVRRKKSVTFAQGTKEGDATTSKNRIPTSREQKAKITYLRRLLRPEMQDEQIANKMNAELTRPPPQNTKNIEERRLKETKSKDWENRPSGQDSKLAPSQSLAGAANNEIRSREEKPGTEAFSAIIPVDETAEDAALRQQMIQYNMADGGAVVAEIDLDEDDSSVWTDEDEVNDSSAEEDEDQHGRTKHRVVDDEYRQEMLALEERLNVKSMKNIGPEGNSSALPPRVEPDKLDRVTPDVTAPVARKSSPTKEVRFAADVQIQDAAHHKHPSTLPSNSQISTPQDRPSAKKASISRFKAERTNPPSTASKPRDSVLASTILERPYNQISTSSPAPPHPPTAIISDKIIERPYKPAASSSPAPPHPPTAIISDKIIERPYNPAAPSSPAPPGTEDPALVHQQLTTEYHRLRNRMIYRQGGFLANDSDDDDDDETGVEVKEEEGGVNQSRGEKAELGHPQHPGGSAQQGGKKMSRFLAARLKGVGGGVN